MRKYPRKIPTLFLFTTPLSPSPPLLSRHSLSPTPLPHSSPHLLSLPLPPGGGSGDGDGFLLFSLTPLPTPPSRRRWSTQATWEGGGGVRRHRSDGGHACAISGHLHHEQRRIWRWEAWLHRCLDPDSRLPRGGGGSGDGDYDGSGRTWPHLAPYLVLAGVDGFKQRRWRWQQRLRGLGFHHFWFFIFTYKRCKHPHAKIRLSRAGAPPHVKIVIFTYHLVCADHPAACENRDWIVWKNRICSSVNSSTPDYVQLSLSCCKHIFLRKYARYHFLILL